MAASNETVTESVVGPLEQVGDQLVAMLPKLGMVLGVIVVGLLVSWLLKRAARWLVRTSGLEAFGERIGVARLLYAIGAKGSLAHFIGTIVWLAGLLLTFSVVAEMLELPGLADAVNALSGFLPKLLAAGFVVAVGLFLAELIRNLVTRAGRKEGDEESEALESPGFVGQLLYYTVVTVSVTIAVEQIGFETALVHTLIAIIAGGCLLAVGLSFALGSRNVVANVLARHYLRSVCRPGDRLRVGSVEGVVVGFTTTAVVLQDGELEHVVPCGLTSLEPVSVERLAEPVPDAPVDEPGAGSRGDGSDVPPPPPDERTVR